MRDVNGYEGLYSVSEEGEIFSRHGNRLSPAYNNGGYPFVNLRKDGIGKCLLVHRLVALAYLESGPGMEVNHKNGDRTDSRLENLEWVTRSQNFWHGYNGLKKFTSGYLAKTRRGIKWDVVRIGNLNQARAVLAMRDDIGFYFPSLQEAARSVCGGAGHIVSCAKGKRDHHAGFRWAYIG